MSDEDEIGECEFTNVSNLIILKIRYSKYRGKM